MRMMLRVTIPTEAGNAAIKSGRLPLVIGAAIEKLKPEATYFTAHEGERSAIFVFDMKDASEMPGIAEPFFMEFNAKIESTPVMNADDLKKGLAQAMHAMKQ
jgi:hypothetical protein